MGPRIVFSVDVEQDLHSSTDKGISEGLVSFEKICDKHGVKPILYVVAQCLPKNKLLFKRLCKKGWTIGLHGFSHARFDDLSVNEKEQEIKKSITYFQKYLGFAPRYFRAPQHSIDSATLDLLEKYGFKQDSSFTPLNIFQLVFFPNRFGNWLMHFFSHLQVYEVRKGVKEVPVSSLFIPFVSLSVRLLPYPVLYLYVQSLRLFYNPLMFYAHSWDFIPLPSSRVDRIFSHKDLLRKLDLIMNLSRRYE